jgi:hypothetical protein
MKLREEQSGRRPLRDVLKEPGKKKKGRRGVAPDR